MHELEITLIQAGGSGEVPPLSEVFAAMAQEAKEREEAHRRAGIVDDHYPTFRNAIIAANPHLRAAADALSNYRGEMHPTLALLAPGNENADVTLVLPLENVTIDQRDGSVMVPVSTLVDLLELMHRHNHDNVLHGPGKARAELHRLRHQGGGRAEARRDTLFRAYGGNPDGPYRPR